MTTLSLKVSAYNVGRKVTTLKDVLAIVGSHPKTRSQFDFDRNDCDVWVFNEAMAADFCKRADAVFQMHKPVIWKNPNNRNDPNHYSWLRSGQTPTIYMMEAYEEVPKAVKYPLDEVLKLTPGVRYFTSSVAYAIALGVYMDYKRIEIYGVEMETNTEYHYQRQGVLFWLGVAMGRGIDISITTCGLFDDPLYGYDGDIVVPYSTFTETIEKSQAEVSEAEKRYNKERDELNVMLEEILALGGDPKKLPGKTVSLSMDASLYGFHDGKRQEAERYKGKADKMVEETGSYIFSRQEFEQAYVSHVKARDNASNQANAFAGKLQVQFEDMMRTATSPERAEKMRDFAITLSKFIETSTKVGVFDGAASVNTEIVKIMDKLIRAAGGSKSEQVMIDAMMTEAVDV